MIQKGYATSPILRYNRKNVAWKLRLKEWDYYLIYNKDYALAITIGSSASILFVSASLLDLKNKTETTKTAVRAITGKRFAMPESSETGDILYQDHKIDLSVRHEGKNRILSLSMPRDLSGDELVSSILLTQEPKDSMVIATPFKESKKMFYYNRKVIGMRASGRVSLGSQEVIFQPADSFGLLDWGRGVWPYHTTWYWSAAQGVVGNNLFGFSLGYGFGDTSAATENMLFFDGKASKLTTVTFHIPRNKKKEYDYRKPWRITSSDDSIEMVFHPIYDRSVNLSFLFLSTNQHQVFGTFTGYAILHDGTIVYLKDFPGFAEMVENRW